MLPISKAGARKIYSVTISSVPASSNSRMSSALKCRRMTSSCLVIVSKDTQSQESALLGSTESEGCQNPLFGSSQSCCHLTDVADWEAICGGLLRGSTGVRMIRMLQIQFISGEISYATARQASLVDQTMHLGSMSIF